MTQNSGTTYIKKIVVGTPIKRVTSGSNSVDNLTGFNVTVASADSGSLLYLDSNNEFIASVSLPQVRSGNIQIKNDVITNVDDAILDVAGKIKVSDLSITSDSDLSTKKYVDDEITKVKHVIFTTDDGFTDSVQIYSGETIKAIGGNGLSTKAIKVGSQYRITIDLDSTGADAGTFGSIGDSSRIPILTTNSLGQITSITQTAALDTDNIIEGNNLYYSRARFDSALGDSTSASKIRSYFSVSGDLLYDSVEGIFSVDVEQVYTTTDFDSDLDAALNSNSNLHWYPDSNYYDLTVKGVDSGTYGSSSLIPVLKIDKYGRIDSAGTVTVAGVNDFTWDSINTATISTADGNSFTAYINQFDSINASKISTTTLSRLATVDSGVYGGASDVPVITVNTSGFIDSIGTVSVAGVTDFTWDSSTLKATISTADGGAFPVILRGKELYNGGTKTFEVTDSGARVYGNLLPSADSTYDLGDSNYKWKDLHLSGNSIFLGSLTLRDSNGNLAIDGQNNDTEISVQRLRADSADIHLIDFGDKYSNTNKPVAPQEGMLFYNTDPNALTYRNDQIEVKLGQEDIVRVYNNSGADIATGKVVYVTGATNDFPTIALAQANSSSTMYRTLGLVSKTIANGTFGYVTTRGLFGGLDTTPFSVGDRVHVSPDSAGELTATSPAFPNFPFEVGSVLVIDSATGGDIGGCVQVDLQRETFETFRLTADGRVDGNWTVAGNLNILGSETKTSVATLAVGDQYITVVEGDTITTAKAVGTGLNDVTFKDHYQGDSDLTYFVIIHDADAGGDVIKWGFDSANGGPAYQSFTYKNFDSDGGQYSWNLNTDGKENIPLRFNVTLDVTANTGHDSGDVWKGTAAPSNLDFGFFGNYNTPSLPFTHAGFYRDAGENRFKIVGRYDSAISGSINTASATFELGDLEAKTFFGPLQGDVTGNASSATILETARKIGISSATMTSDSNTFNGNGDFTINLNINNGAITNALINANAGIVDTKLDTISTAGKVLNSATTATDANTASAIVARDASGNFTAGTITASLSGNIDADSGDIRVLTGRQLTFDSVSTGILEADSASFNRINIPDFDAFANIISVGSDSDAKIFHTGSHFFIRNGTGRTELAQSELDIAPAGGIGTSYAIINDSAFKIQRQLLADSASITGKITADQGKFGTFANDVSTSRPLALLDSNATMLIHRFHPAYDAAVEMKVSDSPNAGLDAYWDIFAQKSDASFNFRDRNISGTPTRLKFTSDGAIVYPFEDSAGKYIIHHNTINRTYENRNNSTTDAVDTVDSNSNPLINIYVRTATKTTNHRFYNQGSTKGYYIAYDSADLYTAREIEAPHIDFVPGTTYRFHTNDSSMATHAIRFYYDDAKNGLVKDSAASIHYLGDAGDVNVGNTYSEIKINDDGPRAIAYQCINHPYMGNSITTNATGGSRIWGTSSGVFVDGQIEGTVDGGTY